MNATDIKELERDEELDDAKRKLNQRIDQLANIVKRVSDYTDNETQITAINMVVSSVDELQREKSQKLSLLNRGIGILGLSKRPFQILIEARITPIIDIINYDGGETGLLKNTALNESDLKEIKVKLSHYALEIGMNIEAFILG